MKMLFVAVLALFVALTSVANPLYAPPNSRYFVNDQGKAVYLSGWHTWNNFQDLSAFPDMDYPGYVQSLAADGSNFIRLWNWEAFRLDHFSCPSGGWGVVSPLPFQRTGPGLAADGKPKFNLTLYNQEFFDRLRHRVKLASDHGIYVMVMFFEAIGPISGSNFNLSPYNAANNVNGVVSKASDVFTLNSPAMTQIYDNYIKKVVDTLNDFDNVLFEPANEPQGYSSTFISHIIDTVHAHEAIKPKRHPVIYSSFYSDVNHVIFAADNADWIAPGATRSNWDPVLYANPKKPWLMDSDHIFYPSTGGWEYVWKCLFRGYNFTHMDAGPVVCPSFGWGTPDDKIRKACGDTVRLANRMDLIHMTPSTTISSTAYALYQTGLEYLVWQPQASTSFTINMAAGAYEYEWFVPELSSFVSQGSISVVDGNNTFVPPAGYSTGAILYLKRAAALPPPVTHTLTVRSSHLDHEVTVTVSPPDNNGATDGVAEFSRTYREGTGVTVTAPSIWDGARFQKWQRDGLDYDASLNTSLTMDRSHTLTAVYVSTVQAAYVFYNGSAWDNNDPAANADDDGAIAPDKVPLRQGGVATSVNYTSYSRGLNGIMVDIAGLAGIPGLNDFSFKVGNDHQPGGWASAPAPATIAVRATAGIEGSDRVTLIWPDEVIEQSWLEVAVLATPSTGLANPEVFYFGNAIGETLHSPADAQVNALDVALTRANLRTLLDPAPIHFPYDHNRDKRVNAGDQLIARANQTTVFNALQLIDLSGAVPHHVAEAAEYVLVYSLEIPDQARFNSTGVPYAVDNHTSVGPFRRIAYYLELQGDPGPVEYLWVSMDAFTTDASKIGVPAAGTGGFFQQPVLNVNVRSSVAGIVNGDDLEGGNIEFWPGNYHNDNALNVLNASRDVYDWGDSVYRHDIGYGSMQVHNSAARQTLFAFNAWGGVVDRAVDLGIGNHAGTHPDWTFAANGSSYVVKRLQVYVLPTGSERYD